MAPQAFLLEPQWFPMKWEVVNLKQKWMGHRRFIFPIKQQHPVMLLMSKAICGYKHVRKLRLPHNNILNSLPRNKFFKNIHFSHLSLLHDTSLCYIFPAYIRPQASPATSKHKGTHVWGRIFTVSTLCCLFNLGLPLFKVMAWGHSNKLPAVYKLADVKHELPIDVDTC